MIVKPLHEKRMTVMRAMEGRAPPARNCRPWPERRPWIVPSLPLSASVRKTIPLRETLPCSLHVSMCCCVLVIIHHHRRRRRHHHHHHHHRHPSDRLFAATRDPNIFVAISLLWLKAVTKALWNTSPPHPSTHIHRTQFDSASQV